MSDEYGLDRPRHRGWQSWAAQDDDQEIDDQEEIWHGGPGHGHRHGPGQRRGPGQRGWPGMPDFGPRPGDFRGRKRARRGDVRAAVLALLRDEPMNGYQIIQQITERSGGLWRASPGSVYPALAQLEDEGLIEAGQAGAGRRSYALTQQGQDYVQAHTEELRAPWEDLQGGSAGAAIRMRGLLGQVHLAVAQVVHAGTAAQLEQARKLLVSTRKELYKILAADDEEAASGPAAGPAHDDGAVR